MTGVQIATLIISALALLVATGNVVYTQGVTDKRELVKWRRDELLKATSELAQLSYHRNAVLSVAFERSLIPTEETEDSFDTGDTGAPHPARSVDLMFVVVERIRLIDADLAAVAERVADAHRSALREADANLACYDRRSRISESSLLFSGRLRTRSVERARSTAQRQRT